MGGLFGGFFGRNFVFTLELTCLSRFCLNGEGRKEGQEFRSLEGQRKLIALKNGFAYVLQFFSLISDDLGGVNCRSSVQYNRHV